ncbi:MAG: hypothetical protein Q9202_003914 [Teloschistes flavicans]
MLMVINVKLRDQTNQAIPREDDHPKPSSSSTNPRQTDRVALAKHERTTKQRDSNQVSAEKKTRELKQELTYLEDPLKLAENTVKLLRKDDHEKALDIVRMATKRTSCVVSWNHIIDYQMSKGKIQPAEKIYNEMKKRAQKPDAQTYTILLRGLSWHPHLQQSLPRALHIYHSMFAENCSVRPNVIHTNAMLNVCAHAKDMDALLGVAARLPTKGPGAPNKITYTIIINAIRSIAWNDDHKIVDRTWDEKSLARQRAVLQGRRLWEEIIVRWRAGDVSIDEELVCAMGRLLLLGSTVRDNEDVLSLAEQVMAIPHQNKRLGELKDSSTVQDPPTTTPKLSKPTEPRWPTSSEADNIISDDNVNIPSTLSTTSSTELTTELKSVFTPGTRDPRITTAVPGRNTLSLLLDACINLRTVAPAQAYWGLLTSPEGPYNISPDMENFHMYLRLLRHQRGSRVAAELVKDLYQDPETKKESRAGLLQPKTFRIAMSTCVRNKLNLKVIEHASSILETMQKALEPPDVKVMEMYVDLLTDVAKTDYKSALGALLAAEKPMKLLKNWMQFGYEDVANADKNDVVRLAQNILGAVQVVVHWGGDRVGTDEMQPLHRLRGWLSEWVRRRQAQMGAKWQRRTILDDLPVGNVGEGGLIRFYKARSVMGPVSEVWNRDLPGERSAVHPLTKPLRLADSEEGEDVGSSAWDQTSTRRLVLAEDDDDDDGDDTVTGEDISRPRWTSTAKEGERERGMMGRGRGGRGDQDPRRRGFDRKTEGGAQKRMQRAERVRKENEELDYE